MAGRNVARHNGTLTFSKDVAPIIFKNCSGCHRSGEAGPFHLLSYDDVTKRARQIAEVTASRQMPPWLPEPGFGDLADARRLDVREMEILQQWIADGAPQGNPADLPPLPRWSEGWQLGPPDLVVRLPHPYTLPAGGTDVYRNFVFPIPVSALKYIRGVEFRPGNARALHHAFINIDETRQSLRQADNEIPRGFYGMELPDTAVMPRGQFLSWQPGKTPSFSSDGLSWMLKPGTDFVLQMHMQPSGKLETLQPEIGLYFTDQPPSKPAFRVMVRRLDFKIPAGDSNYVVESSYTMPVDVEITRILPHAHYLGKDLQCYAMLPTGEKKWLIWIKDWDFNWQGDYRYISPVPLPKGSRLVLRYGYDNSTNNVRNPNQPPRDVIQGERTADEMASVSLQATTRTPDELAVLARDSTEFHVRISADYYRFRLQLDPADAEAHTRLGRVLMSQGRFLEALTHLTEAVRAKPDNDKAHYELGYLHLLQNRLSEAYAEFETVIRYNPKDFQAFGNLGFISLKTGRYAEAEQFLETALRLNPEDEIARKNLGLLQSRK